MSDASWHPKPASLVGLGPRCAVALVAPSCVQAVGQARQSADGSAHAAALGFCGAGPGRPSASLQREVQVAHPGLPAVRPLHQSRHAGTGNHRPQGHVVQRLGAQQEWPLKQGWLPRQEAAENAQLGTVTLQPWAPPRAAQSLLPRSRDQSGVVVAVAALAHQLLLLPPTLCPQDRLLPQVPPRRPCGAGPLQPAWSPPEVASLGLLASAGVGAPGGGFRHLGSPGSSCCHRRCPPGSLRCG